MTTVAQNTQSINGKSTADLLKIVPTSALEGELARRRAEARELRRQKDAAEGEKLRILRESMNLTQFEAAQFLGIAQSQLCWAETGRRGGAAIMISRLEAVKKIGSEKT